MPETTERAELIGFVLTHSLLRNELPRLGGRARRGTDDASRRRSSSRTTCGWSPTTCCVTTARRTSSTGRSSCREHRAQPGCSLSSRPSTPRWTRSIDVVRDRQLSRGQRTRIAMARLSELVLAHLEVEDRSVVPLLAVHVTAEEQRGSMERSRAKIPPADELRVLAMMLAAADEDERARMLAPLPDSWWTAWSEQAAPALTQRAPDTRRRLGPPCLRSSVMTSAKLGSATGGGHA